MAKRHLPKTVVKKRIAKTVFWVLAGYLLFSVTILLIRPTTGETVEATALEEERPPNPAMAVGVEAFANNFAYHYFTWGSDKEAIDNRRDRLSPYLAAGVDPQAGLNTRNLKSSSQYQKSQVWRMEEAGEQKAKITLRSQHTLVIGEQKMTKQVYLVVPVAGNGENFVVYDTPYFIPEPKPVQLEPEARFDPSKLIRTPALTKEVGDFLDSFFKVYATGKEEELAYFTEDVHIEGLAGVLHYSAIDRHDVYARDSEPDTYQIHAHIVFEDQAGSTQFTFPYVLDIKQMDGRWFVIGFEN